MKHIKKYNESQDPSKHQVYYKYFMMIIQKRNKIY